MVDIKEVCADLDAMAQDLAQELLPRGKWDQKNVIWQDARRGDGGLGDGLKVWVRTGRWKHFGEPDKRGDMLELACYVHGWPKGEAFRWALKRTGRIDELGKPLAPSNRPKLAPRAPIGVPADELRAKRRKAMALWVEGAADLRGTPAGIYLEGRGIELGKLYEQKLGLGALHYHPRCYCSNLSDPGRNVYTRIPAMLALAIRPSGKIATIHRTYLIERAPGRWDRYREDRDGWDGKKLYSPILGGVVPLWRGRRHDGDGVIRKGYGYSDDKSGPAIDLAEGIEDGLSIACIEPDCRVATPLSLSNAVNMRLPEIYTKRFWWKQNDAGNVAIEGDETREGLFAKVIAHLGSPPNELFLVDMPAGIDDVNEALTAAAPSHNQAEDAGRSQGQAETGAG